MRLCMLLLACVATFAAGTTSAANEDIAVSVSQSGEKVVIDVAMPVQATVAEVWDVLTDYEHMARFISSLESSAVLARHGNRLEVEQIGEARVGLLAYSFDTVRAIDLVPYREIRSTLISGKFKSYSFVTRIVDNGASVTIVNHGEYVPTTWVPPVIGPAMIESQTRNQYAEIRDEIARRKGLAARR